jgi:hypothetical protein
MGHQQCSNVRSLFNLINVKSTVQDPWRTGHRTYENKRREHTAPICSRVLAGAADRRWPLHTAKGTVIARVSLFHEESRPSSFTLICK